MPEITANGAQFEYVEQGQGEPLILVHGALGDFRTSPLQLESFAKYYRVIAYSRRYHYPNPWVGDGRDYSPLLHSEDLAALITSLGLDRAHIVGSSYGAYIALFLAVRHSELVRTLVLGEPPIYSWLEQHPEGRTLLADYRSIAWEPARQAFYQGELEQATQLFIDGVLGAGTFDQIPPPARETMLDNVLALKAEVATPGDFPPLTSEDTRHIAAPALLLTGEWSPRLFLLMTDELERGMPSCERAMIPETSHAMASGNPEAYNKIVLDFLAKHSKAD